MRQRLNITKEEFEQAKEEVVKALCDYRVLKVRFQNQQEREMFGVQLLFPELNTKENQEKYIRYTQVKRALEEALDEHERKILEMKFMNTKELNDDYIYDVMGIKKGTYYRKKKSSVINFADALGII